MLRPCCCMSPDRLLHLCVKSKVLRTDDVAASINACVQQATEFGRIRARFGRVQANPNPNRTKFGQLWGKLDKAWPNLGPISPQSRPNLAISTDFGTILEDFDPHHRSLREG